MPGANFLGHIDHSEFGALGVNLAFGQRRDGSIAHISEVERGRACDCVCPACGAELVAHKGSTKHHFKHRAEASNCTYSPETNAHYFAKQVLERVKWITLPERAVSVEGGSRLVHTDKPFEFDTVVVEKREGGIIPDLIVTKNGQPLLVEVFVTHRCDDAKIAYIRGLGISAIEVDLSAYRKEPDDKAIEDAFLRTAPRTWLFNRHTEADQAKLRSEIAARKQAEARKTEQRARRILKAIRDGRPSRAASSDDLDDMAAFERSHLVGIGAQADGFSVPTAEWQAQLFMRAIFSQSRDKWMSFHIDTELALRQISDCIIPELQEPLPPKLQAALMAVAPKLVLPAKAVDAYIAHLAGEGVLEPGFGPGYGGEQAAEHFTVAHHESEDLHRRYEERQAGQKHERDFEPRLQAIMNRVGADDCAGFDLAAWKASVPGFGMSLSAICSNSELWARLGAAMRSLEAMVRGGAPAPGHHHLGLPVARLVADAREADKRRRDEAEQAEAATQRQEREGRIARMRRAAQQAIGPEADAWLATPDTQGLTPLENAAEGFAAVTALYDQLHGMKQARDAQDRADQLAAQCQDRLRKAAVAAYIQRPELAAVFLGATHPALGMKSPLAYCRDEVSLRRCMELLPGRRR